MQRAFLIHGWDGRPDNHWFPWLSLELMANGFEVNAPQLPHAAEPKVKEWLDFLRDYVGKPDKDTYFVGHSLGCIAIARYLAELSSDSPFPKGSTPSSEEGFKSSALADSGTSFRKGGIRVGGCVFVAGFSGFAREQSERLQNLNPAPIPGRARVRIGHALAGEARVRMASGAGVERPFYTMPEIAEFYSLPFDPEKARQHCDRFVMIFSDNDPYVPVAKSLEFAKQLGAKTILERGKGHFTAGDEVTALPNVLSALLAASKQRA